MGIIVLAVAILPLLGVGGMQMFKAETPGPMKDSKLTAAHRRDRQGRCGWSISASPWPASCRCKLAGMTGSMPSCHAFATMGLGGFSTHDASFGYFEFAGHRGGADRLHAAGRHEFRHPFPRLARRAASSPTGATRRPRLVARVIVVSVLGIAALSLARWAPIPTSRPRLRHAAFNVVSIATTSGFASTDYDLWPIFAPLWMLFLSSFATSSGSTGGGIKMIRALILYKQVLPRADALDPSARRLRRSSVGGDADRRNNIVFAVLAFMLHLHRAASSR